MWELLFWLLLFSAGYSYFIYPALLLLLSKLQPKEETVAQTAHSGKKQLSLIITVHNEKTRIREKLENTLELDFDRSRLEIIVASDCSSDGTDEIVNEYNQHGIQLVRAGERLGKENAQLCGIKKAKGEIIVFSDVATKIPSDALKVLEHYFDDENIGAVSSEDRLISQDGNVAGEGAYVKYEMWLRNQESKLAGLIGLSGSFFACRKEVCEDWDIYSTSDFNTALNCARLGYKSVSAPDVLGYYLDLKDAKKEYARKVRTVIQGITAIARHPDVLSLRKFKLFSFQIWSHKVMRWLVPWFLLLLAPVSLVVAHNSIIYVLFLIGEIAFYSIAITATFSNEFRKRSIAKIIYFFVQANIAIFEAGCRFLSGQKMITWTPSER